MAIRSFIILLVSFSWSVLTAQNWAFHINGNETYPVFNELKTQHPILWYSKAQEKIVFGGYGVGVSNARSWKGKSTLRFQANAQRSRFYDIPSIIRDENGNPLGASLGVNTNYNLALLSMILLPLDEKNRFHAGIGLGMRATVFSQTKYKATNYNGDEKDYRLRNKSLTPVVLLLPMMVQVNFGRFSVAGRGELAITRTNRIDEWSKERSFVTFIELGYRISQE